MSESTLTIRPGHPFNARVWQAHVLGTPLPPSEHAVSVAMPEWNHVVGYEERRRDIHDQLQTGYPRFFTHRLVGKLAELLAPGVPCLPFPSIEVAEMCCEYVKKRSGQASRVVTARGVFGVATSIEGKPAMQEFWQHTGLIVSSRRAESVLRGRSVKTDPEIQQTLTKRLAGYYDCDESDVLLQPTGMAAQFAALRVAAAREPGLRTAQLGFPYVDTFKLQERFGNGGVMLHHIQTIEQELQAVLGHERLSACFCEIPGNPLLGSTDLKRVSPLLRSHKIPLVVDDVVATPYNIDVSPYADLVATSLTKFISGRGDVMGGALILNPHSPLHDELRSIAQAQHRDLLWPEDLQVLEELSRDFPERMRQHNQNGLFIAEKLRSHPAVEHVWYPKWEFTEAYESVRRPQGGWGALVTFLPRDSQNTSPGVYDRLPLCKGPSLGTVFSLACPFTLLAHYTELDWAEACGVPRNLIRISVGLEDPQALWAGIDQALRS